ncbi:hypothetical protein GBK02_09135 [Dechloromonas sp. TW-R-39-2]|uniref:Mor transcription activator family protein n=1 Tax=Dechloromonas sp. TW-R-39-2 TaxID=2654218 RepID=UPI00193CD960|nr:Mor transcription activator family protein [Dechloromonas sp. TW-R-39-2]QRM19553.1 hypothetical protein GBK02_09135 [Dechloromonas sp. TW-R-39-2]
MNTTSSVIDTDNAVALHAELTGILIEEATIPEIEASQLADALMRGLRRRFPGESIYIAKTLSVRERHERDNAIRRDFNGRNMAEICRRWGIGRLTVYRALGRR